MIDVWFKRKYILGERQQTIYAIEREKMNKSRDFDHDDDDEEEEKNDKSVDL